MYRPGPLVLWSFMLCLLSGVATAAPAKQDAPRRVERPSRGGVIGYVLDAQTHHPIEGVRVMVEEDGVFDSAVLALWYSQTVPVSCSNSAST